MSEMTKFTPENGGASSSSADSRRLLDVQREPHDENESLQLLKQKAIPQAAGGRSEEGRKASPFGTAGASAETDQAELENDDTRFKSPKSMHEALILESALEKTRVHYMTLTGEYALSSPPFKNYMTQWQFIQDQWDAHWILAGGSGEPPRLFKLGPWRGKLENWKQVDEQDLED